MTAARLRVLIVDDEPLGRRRLQRLLSAQSGVVCVGECHTGDTAVEWLETHQADVVLLDIQMPGMSGLDVIRRVGVNRMPAVIFVTAFDRYAVAAFSSNATDYLLKPFDRTRLTEALGRVRRRLELESAADLAARLELQLRASNQASPT